MLLSGSICIVGNVGGRFGEDEKKPISLVLLYRSFVSESSCVIGVECRPVDCVSATCAYITHNATKLLILIRLHAVSTRLVNTHV